MNVSVKKSTMNWFWLIVLWCPCQGEVLLIVTRMSPCGGVETLCFNLIFKGIVKWQTKERWSYFLGLSYLNSETNMKLPFYQHHFSHQMQYLSFCSVSCIYGPYDVSIRKIRSGIFDYLLNMNIRISLSLSFWSEYFRYGFV